MRNIGSSTALTLELEMVQGINVWLSCWQKCLGVVCPCYIHICLVFKSNTYEKGPTELLLHRLLFFLTHSSLQHNQRSSNVLTGLEQSSPKKPIFTLGQPLPWLCPYLGLSLCFPHHPGSSKLCAMLRMRGGGEQVYLLRLSFLSPEENNRECRYRTICISICNIPHHPCHPGKWLLGSNLSPRDLVHPALLPRYRCSISGPAVKYRMMYNSQVLLWLNHMSF